MTLSPLQELARLELEPCTCDPREFGQCDRCDRMAVLEAEIDDWYWQMVGDDDQAHEFAAEAA